MDIKQTASEVVEKVLGTDYLTMGRRVSIILMGIGVLGVVATTLKHSDATEEIAEKAIPILETIPTEQTDTIIETVSEVAAEAVN